MAIDSTKDVKYVNKLVTEVIDSTKNVKYVNKLVTDKHVNALEAHVNALEACEQYISDVNSCKFKLNATGIHYLIDAYMAIASTKDVQSAIKLVTDKHTDAFEACKQYVASVKSKILTLETLNETVCKLNAYNAEAAAFVDNFSYKSANVSNDANVCKILYMIASEKTSATLTAAEFTKLL